MQSVTPEYVSSVLARFSDCSLVFITALKKAQVIVYLGCFSEAESKTLRLTIDGVDSDSCCAPGDAARHERHVKRSGAFAGSLPQVIQIGKEREIDDGERDVPDHQETKQSDLSRGDQPLR